MNIKKYIIETLMSIGLPVSFQNYSGSESTYITFFTYLEQGEEWAENQETATGYYVQIDIFSKGDYTSIEEQVKTNMEAAGFKRTFARDEYEGDTKIFHKVLRFSYVN